MTKISMKVQSALLALAVLMGAFAGIAVPTPASANCPVPLIAAAKSIKRNKDEISRQAAATMVATEAAKDCLAMIDRALNISIPGIAFVIDWQGLLRSLLNRACQVVTSKIDEAGRLIEDTASDANNRFIGSVNDALGNDVNGYIGARQGNSTSTGGINGMDFGGNTPPAGQTISGGGYNPGAPANSDPTPSNGPVQPDSTPNAQPQSTGILNSLACMLSGNCPGK